MNVLYVPGNVALLLWARTAVVRRGPSECVACAGTAGEVNTAYQVNDPRSAAISLPGFVAEPRLVPEVFAPHAAPFVYPALKSLKPIVWPTVDHEPPSLKFCRDQEVLELR